jgi:hypothetical protein
MGPIQNGNAVHGTRVNPPIDRDLGPANVYKIPFEAGKSVLPVLTGRSYADLEIQEGGQASLEFLRINFGDVTDEERCKVRKQLEQYCGRDTEGMIWIVEAIERMCR